MHKTEERDTSKSRQENWDKHPTWLSLYSVTHEHGFLLLFGTPENHTTNKQMVVWPTRP